ncbi:hypothetical protein D9M70_349350 [compost metagenome]
MLADQPDQRHQPDLGIDVQARQAEEQRHHRAADRQRHGDHDHQRIAEALELRRQHQEDHRQRQAEGEHQRAAFLHVLAGGAGVVEGEAARRFLLGDLPHRVDGLAHADHRHAGNGRRVELLELVELARPRVFADLHQGRQGNQLAALALHVVAAEPAGIVAILPLDLGDHLVAAAVDGEAVDLALAEQAGQGDAEVLHGHAHLRRLGAVDVDHQFRLVEGQVEVHEGELAGLLGAFLHPLGHLQQRLVVVRRVDHELERQAFAGAGQRGQVEAEDLQPRNLVQLGLHREEQFHLAAFALVPRLQQHAADAGLHAVVAVDLERRVVLREALEDFLELRGEAVQVVEVGGLRRIGHEEDDALVLLGSEFALDELRQQHERNQHHHDQREQQHHRPTVQRRMQQALVTPLEALEDQVQAMRQAAGVLVVAQQARAHHRRQGQGDDAGDDHRAGQGEGELLEQRAGEAAEEADRRIHGGQGDGHGHHRHGDLPCALDGRVERRLAFLDVAVDVLHHDDGVVHHQADGEHHRQQRQQVDRVAHRLHEEQHADHRQRDGHHRDQHRAEGAEEQEDHDYDDQHRLAEGLHHLVDGGLDEARGVVGDGDLEVRRQLFFQLGHLRPHFPDHVQRVGTRRALDGDVHRGDAVERADRVVAGRAQFHARHVAHQHAAVADGLQRDGGEGLGGFQVGGGVHAGHHHLALHLAGGGEEVVLAHRVVDVAGGDAVGGHLHRVEPEAHGELLVAEDFRLGDAGQGGELGLDHPRQVVGDLRVVHLLAVEADVHQRRGVGGFLVEDRVLGVGRQLGLHLADLRQQLGHQAVGVGADVRVDGDHRVVLPAHRGHVVDAFGAGQALLQRLGDVALDGLRVGPGVEGGDGDQRVFHLRILADHQFAERLHAEQDDQQADHRRQYRAADEGIGESHVTRSAVPGPGPGRPR